MTTATRSRKPRQRRAHVRTVKVLCEPTAANPATFIRITQDGAQSYYWVTPAPSDFGTAYRVEKSPVDGGEGYDVLLSAEGDSCTCKGHTYGGYCKHADAVRALRQAGKL